LIALSLIVFVCATKISQNNWDGVVEEDDKQVLTEEFVNQINAKAKTWVASTNQGKMTGITKGQAKGLCGTKMDRPNRLQKITHKNLDMSIPASFDARKNWPHCETMRVIRDQSACGSCWAFGAVEAMSDRMCVFKGVNVNISAQDMNSCCDSCGDGCGGGYPDQAWQYWVQTGVVSENCDPYSLPGCDHHLNHSKNPCPKQEYPTPPCVQTCTDGEQWNSALHYGAIAYYLSGEQDMQLEIMTNGSVEATFTVYSDFLGYKSGVYQYTTGDVLGGHAVKILGWGTLSGTPYWLVANSWNPDWGMEGYFLILRGQDECGIEDDISAGTPA